MSTMTDSKTAVDDVDVDVDAIGCLFLLDLLPA
jgi:hypothetical protein